MPRCGGAAQDDVIRPACQEEVRGSGGSCSTVDAELLEHLRPVGHEQ
jgi:hypothetical protein